MTRRVEMVHVMRALDSVLGAPTVTSNQGAALAAFLNDQVAVEVKPVTWGVVAPWYARNEQMLKDVGKFEGVKGIALEVWRGATEELRQELAARDEVIDVLKKRRGKGASVHRRYVDNLKARHKAELEGLKSELAALKVGLV